MADQYVRVAISGKSGCGNTTVSRMLAERLAVPVINYTFHTMAEEEGVTFDEMCRMAESDDKWDLHLDREQVRRARRQSCVLGSRLAIWVLEEATLKVYLTAPERVRAGRIREREGGELEEVLAQTRERDRRDHARYVRLYNIDTNSYDFADLIIETDRHAPDEIVELIRQALTRRLPGLMHAR